MIQRLQAERTGLSGRSKRRNKVTITHPVWEIMRWAGSGSSPSACDRPHRFHPVRSLFGSREGILGAKVASINCLRLSYGATHLLVGCLILRYIEPSSVRNRLFRRFFLLSAGRVKQTCEYLDNVERFFRVFSIGSRVRQFGKAPFRVQPDPHLSRPERAKSR